MQRAAWQRLDLTEEEWRECQLSAIEMSLASGARVSPRDVAIEYALARAFEEGARPATRAAHDPMEDTLRAARPGAFEPARRRA